MEKADPHLTYKFMKNPGICEWIPPIFGFSFPNIRTPNLPTRQRSNTASICLFEGNETGRVGGTNTGTTVLDGLAVWLLATYMKILRDWRKETYYEMENSAR